MLGKPRNILLSDRFAGQEGRKGFAKAAGAKPSGRMRNKNSHVAVMRRKF